MTTLKTISIAPLVAHTKPYVMQFRALDRPGQPTLSLPYNPESYEVRIGPRWSPRNGAGAEFDESDWEGNSPRVLSYSHLLRAADVPGPRGGDIESVVQDFDLWATQPVLSTQRPTRLRVTAGDGLTLTGVITALSYRRVRTSPQGLALTVEFDLEITEQNFGV